MEKRAGQTQDKLWIFDLIVLKLRKYGADEKTINLISDCLSDRHHCVKLGHTFSFFSFLSFGLRSLYPYNCEVSRKIHSFLAECQSDHISKQIFYVVMLNILQLLAREYWGAWRSYSCSILQTPPTRGARIHLTCKKAEVKIQTYYSISSGLGSMDTTQSTRTYTWCPLPLSYTIIWKIVPLSHTFLLTSFSDLCIPFNYCKCTIFKI